MDGVAVVQEVMDASWMRRMTLGVAEMVQEMNKDVEGLENAPGSLESSGLMLEMQ
jgi:hypothetical protein